MDIRKATYNDLEDIMAIYERARKFMAETGNPTQWGSGYPKRSLIEQDIKDGVFYVCVSGGRIEAVFALIGGIDPTYVKIYDGAWINDESYWTIHRMASSGRLQGMTAACIGWCFKKYGNLRADTHDDNKIMQHLLEKNGFEKCGRIFTHDGTPRIAYQKIR